MCFSSLTISSQLRIAINTNYFVVSYLEVAVNEAKLGTIDELIQFVENCCLCFNGNGSLSVEFLIFFLFRCVKTADILKPAKHAAREMMSVLRPESE